MFSWSDRIWNLTCSIQIYIGGNHNDSGTPINFENSVVDDEAQGLWLRAQVMTFCGFTVMTADGPAAALSLMAEEGTDKIDLAILDYDMPVMNGCALADQLRSMRPKLKIILYSGAVDIPQKEMTSVDAFVAKDDGPARLLDQIVQIAQVMKPELPVPQQPLSQFQERP